MPARVSPKDFLSWAYKKGSKTNKDVINKDEVKKELQPTTKYKYSRAVAL